MLNQNYYETINQNFSLRPCKRQIRLIPPPCLPPFCDILEGI